MTSSSLALPRLVRRTMILNISKINYHIFSPLDQHRSGNDPHHPRCPRYVINGSALSTRTSCHLPRGLLFNLLHNFLWSHIITLGSSLTWQKHDAQRKDRGSCCSTSLDRPDVLLSKHFTFSCWGYSHGNSKIIEYRCLFENPPFLSLVNQSQHLLTFPPTCSLNKTRSIAEASWGTKLYS